MGYTDSEMRNFTQIAYADLEKGYDYLSAMYPERSSFTIKELAEATKMVDKTANLEPLSCLTEEQFSTWSISGIHDTNSTNGFYACIIETSPGNAVVGFRGSEDPKDPSNLVNDWIKADLGLLNSTCTNQQAEVERFLNMYKDQLGSYDSLAMTGHSLGGNLAEYATIVSGKYSLDDKITQCVSMDGPGFSNEFLMKYRKEIQSMSGVMKHYRWSLVGGLLFDLPGVDYQFVGVSDENHDDKMNSLTRHDTKYLVYDENGNLIPSEQDGLAKATRAFSQAVEIMPHIDTNKFIAMLIYNFLIGSTYLYHRLFDDGGLIDYIFKNYIKDYYTDFVNFIRKIGERNNDYLRVNTEKLSRDAATVENLIQNIIRKVDEMFEEVQSLNGMWTGTANNAFRAKFSKEHSEIKKYLNDFKDYSNKLTEDSNEYNNCENYAINMANAIRI